MAAMEMRRFEGDDRTSSTRICSPATLAFAATLSNDRIGVIGFSHAPTTHLPPRKGRRHVMRMIDELARSPKPNQQTSIASALQFVRNALKRRTVCFIISDFMDGGYKDELKRLNVRHEPILFRISDPVEHNLPSVGLLPVRDLETGTLQWIDSDDPALRKQRETKIHEEQRMLGDFTSKNGIDLVDISTEANIATPLLRFFRARSNRLRGGRA